MSHTALAAEALIPLVGDREADGSASLRGTNSRFTPLRAHFAPSRAGAREGRNEREVSQMRFPRRSAC